MWVQNMDHTWKNVVDGIPIAPVSGSIAIAGFQPNRTYALEWWDTYKTTNQKYLTESIVADSSGVLTIEIVDLVKDVAIKVIGDGSVPVPSLSPPGNVTVAEGRKYY
jgi:hypothetical protein